VRYIDPDGRDINTKAIKAYLEKHPIGREALAAIKNGDVKLKAVSYYTYYKSYVDNDKVEGPFKAHGFFRSTDDTIVVSTIGFTSENIASTIVHEYTHYTQKGKNMTEIEKEYEAHIKQAEYNLSLGFDQKDSSFIKENKIDREAVKSYVDGMYGYSEGKKREVNIIKENIAPERVIDL